MLGEIYEQKRDYQNAIEMYQYSLEWLKKRENNEAQSKPNLAWGMTNSASRCALVLAKLGRKNESEQTIAKPWKEYSEFLARETNASSLIYEHEPLMFLARYFRETN